MNEGKAVLSHIKGLPGGITAFVKKIGMDRTTFYRYCQTRISSQEFISQLKKAGVDPANLPNIEGIPKDSVEIPVILDASRRAILYMPKDYSSKDMKKLVRVLEAYI